MINVVKIRKVRNQPYYNMQLELDEEDETALIIEGLRILAKEINVNVQITPCDPSKNYDNVERVELSDEENRELIELAVVTLLQQHIERESK